MTNTNLRIRVIEFSAGHKRVYAANTALFSDMSKVYARRYVLVHLRRMTNEEMFSELGAQFAQLFSTFWNIKKPLISDMYIDNGEITLEKLDGYYWSEVEAAYLDAFRQAYGPVAIKRQSIFRRATFWVRRNITAVLFPHWYK